jgi:hypothetical protein
MIHEAGVLHFDGTHRILTPLERFTPSTLEVWVQPKFYPKRDSQFFLGSDIPTRHGLSLGLSEAILCAEYIPGVIFSESAIPLDRFSHAAVVFGPTETRLYLGGRKVAVGPATQTTGGAPFVVGNVGSGNPINFFVGKIRAVRISRGERFSADFLPDETFVADAADTPTRAVLIYDGTPGPGDRVPDQSGAGNHGRWERVPLASPAP